jgi:nucleoside-diphosphate-sugar epimerase
MRVLVTGAFGNVGRSTLAALSALDDEVTVLEADSARSRRLAPRLGRELSAGAKPAFASVLYGDIRDPRLTAKAVAGQDAVIHLAALIPPAADADPELATSINVGGTRSLIEALQAGGGQTRLILASSISAYGDRVRNFWIRSSDELNPSPGDAYGRSKVEAEALVRDSGLPYTILRLTYIVWRKKLDPDPLLFHMPLETKIEICHTEDTGRAFAASAHAADAAGRTLNIGGGESCRTDYRSYLRRMFALFGLGGRKSLPDEAFAKGGFHCGWYADSEEAEGLLHFQRKGLEDYYREVAEETRWLRIGAFLARPIILGRLLATSPFFRKARSPA